MRADRSPKVVRKAALLIRANFAGSVRHIVAHFLVGDKCHHLQVERAKLCCATPGFREGNGRGLIISCSVAGSCSESAGSSFFRVEQNSLPGNG